MIEEVWYSQTENEFIIFINSGEFVIVETSSAFYVIKYTEFKRSISKFKLVKIGEL